MNAGAYGRVLLCGGGTGYAGGVDYGREFFV